LRATRFAAQLRLELCAARPARARCRPADPCRTEGRAWGAAGLARKCSSSAAGGARRAAARRRRLFQDATREPRHGLHGARLAGGKVLERGGEVTLLALQLLDLLGERGLARLEAGDVEAKLGAPRAERGVKRFAGLALSICEPCLELGGPRGQPALEIADHPGAEILGGLLDVGLALRAAIL